METRSSRGCNSPNCTYWHFHCDGPHGLPLPTRQAQTDWMTYCIKGGPAPKPLADYWALSTGDHSGANDPCTFAALPFPTNAAFFTATHQVRDLKGFRSIYDLLAERARALARKRTAVLRVPSRAEVRRRADAQREIVRRRAGIRSLAELVGGPLGDRPLPAVKAFDHPKFGWWYLKGAYGCRRENEAAMLATLGRSVVGRDAERIILDAVAEIRKFHPEVTLEELQISDFKLQKADGLISDFKLQKADGQISDCKSQKAGGLKIGCRFQIPLRATGWDCIAAAHAYAAEPQLFSRVEFTNPPPSWTEMVTNPDPKNDSFAIAVWGALEEYDWTDLVDKTDAKFPRSVDAFVSNASNKDGVFRFDAIETIASTGFETSPDTGVKTPCK